MEAPEPSCRPGACYIFYFIFSPFFFFCISVKAPDSFLLVFFVNRRMFVGCVWMACVPGVVWERRDPCMVVFIHDRVLCN